MTKHCSCCGHLYDAAAWAALPCIGFMDFDDEDGRMRLVLKNCACGSTLATEEVVP